MRTIDITNVVAPLSDVKKMLEIISVSYNATIEVKEDRVLATFPDDVWDFLEQNGPDAYKAYRDKVGQK
jgi:hypothetical protein